MVSGLMNVAAELAEGVAAGLGIREMPTPMPKVMTRKVTPKVTISQTLSLFARPGGGSIRTRRVAILVADGCDGEALVALAGRLTREGAVPRFVATKGLWTAPDGHTEQDNVVMVEVVTHRFDRAWWRTYAATLVTRFDQRVSTCAPRLWRC